MTATDNQLNDPLIDNWDWQLSAACRGMDSEAFFHPTGESKCARRSRIEAAKAICETCPVIQQCLDHALRIREPYGIWGGQSEDERAEILGLRNLRYPRQARRFRIPDPLIGQQP